MKAMIFAAGFGSRLKPITNHTPKPLIEVQGKRILDWIIGYLCHYNFREFVFNLHYLSNKIQSHLENQYFQLPFHFLHEKEILGTGKGLYQAKVYLNQDDFLLFNSDILTTVDLSELNKKHRGNKCLATLAVQKRTGDSLLIIDETGKVCGITQGERKCFYIKPHGEIQTVGFCGIHMISPRFFDLGTSCLHFSIIKMYQAMIETGEIVQTWNIQDKYWVDIGTHESLLRAQEEYPALNLRYR